MRIHWANNSSTAWSSQAPKNPARANKVGNKKATFSRHILSKAGQPKQDIINRSHKKRQKTLRAQATGRSVKRNKTSMLGNFVFIGNLNTTVTHEDVTREFSSCGQVTRVQIRCGRGQGVTAGAAIPAALRTRRDFLYASVEFSDVMGVRNALEKNQDILHGYPMTVCLSSGELPEVSDIMDRYEAELLKRVPGAINPDPDTAPSSSRSRTVDSDINQEVPSTVKPDRNHFLGYSFAKCLA